MSMRLGDVAYQGLITTRAMCLQDHAGAARVVNYGRGTWHMQIRQVINSYTLSHIISHAIEL